MKRYWVVAWDQYYPSGELRNVNSTHASRAEAEAAKDALLLPDKNYYDYVEVVDVSERLGIPEEPQPMSDSPPD